MTLDGSSRNDYFDILNLYFKKCITSKGKQTTLTTT
jgi:hypothetical protein